MKNIIYLLFIYSLCSTACRQGNTALANTTTDSLSSDSSAILPFSYNGHLYFRFSINDSVQGNFVLDTGADVLYLDSIFFESTQLPQKDVHKEYLRGIGNNTQTVKCIMDQYICTCGPLTFRPSCTIITHLRPIIGRHIDGVIGINALKDSIIAIDYVKKEMRIIRRTHLSTEGYERIPCKIRNNRIYFPATLQVTPTVRIEGEYVLDTGNGGGIELTSSFAQKNSLARILPQKVRTYTNWGGIGGSSSCYLAHAEAFFIGNQKLSAPTISYFEDQSGAMASEDYNGLIGNMIMERFDLIVDVPDSCLYLRPNKNHQLPFSTTTTGFSYVDRTDICDGWVVRALFAGLPPERAGLQIGDVIVSINGRKTKDISFDEQKAFIEKLKSPYTIVVEHNKQLIELVLPVVKKQTN